MVMLLRLCAPLGLSWISVALANGIIQHGCVEEIAGGRMN
jgi:hypothetical protein